MRKLGTLPFLEFWASGIPSPTEVLCAAFFKKSCATCSRRAPRKAIIVQARLCERIVLNIGILGLRTFMLYAGSSLATELSASQPQAW